jgi:hypothetical protein
MRPCDCKDEQDVLKLEEVGITTNDRSISVTSTMIVLKIGFCKLKIPKNTFKLFAEWYLEDQPENKNISEKPKMLKL